MIYTLVPILLFIILLSMVYLGTITGGFVACFGLGIPSILLLGFSIWQYKRRVSP